MSRLLTFLLLFSLPFQLSFHYFLPQSLVLGRQIDYLAPALFISDVFLLSTFFYMLIKRQLAFSRGIKLGLCLIIVLGLVSSLVAQVKVVSFYEFFKIVEFFCFGWLIYSYKPTVPEILIPLGLASLATCALAIGQFMNQAALGGAWYLFGERAFNAATPGIAQVSVGGRLFLRPYGTFPHPNVLAGFLTVLLPLWFTLKSKSFFLYALKHLVIFVSLIVIGLTFSRIAWVVTVGMLVWLVGRKRFKLTKFYQMCVMVAILLLGVLVEEMVVGRFSSLASFDSQSIEGRSKLQSAAFNMLARFPLVGVGLGNFIPQLPTSSSPPYLLQPVHSIYLFVAAETGVLGLGIFLFMLYLALGTKLAPLRLGLVSLAILGLFDHYWVTLQQAQLLFALLIAMAYATLRDTGQKYVS